MKIVILESSPNRNGASNTLAGYFIKGAKEAGHTICVLDVARMNIRPCSGCYLGKHMGHCIVPDDIGRIENELYDADMIVYVTPVYFYDMSAQLKIIVDRLHCFYANLSGKKSLLLATAFRSDEEVMSHLYSLYQGIAKFLRYDNLGAIMAKGCGTSDAIHSSQYADKAYQLGKKL